MATVVLVLLALSPLLSGAVAREAAGAGTELNSVSTQLCSASEREAALRDASSCSSSTVVSVLAAAAMTWSSSRLAA